MWTDAVFTVEGLIPPSWQKCVMISKLFCLNRIARLPPDLAICP